MRSSGHGGVPGALTGLAMELNQRPEPGGLPTDDGDHQWQPQRAGPDERGGGPADADPARQRVLQRPAVDSLPGQRWAVPAGPDDLGAAPDLQQEFEFLG